MNGQKHCVFISGGTGYLGQPLIMELLGRGHQVRALVRAGSESKLPPECEAVTGNALGLTLTPLKCALQTPLCNWLEWPIPILPKLPSSAA
jgi:nucleoside-diphosphate-sugar epimerase